MQPSASNFSPKPNRLHTQNRFIEELLMSCTPNKKSNASGNKLSMASPEISYGLDNGIMSMVGQRASSTTHAKFHTYTD
eukprot:5309838-Amphidinium_carterae.1